MEELRHSSSLCSLVGALVMVRASPWNHHDRAFIIGDAVSVHK
jgi:hypothetical protein